MRTGVQSCLVIESLMGGGFNSPVLLTNSPKKREITVFVDNGYSCNITNNLVRRNPHLLKYAYRFRYLQYSQITKINVNVLSFVFIIIVRNI